MKKIKNNSINEITKVKYEKYYLKKRREKLYPTEFVVRIFKGNYPNFKLSKQKKFEKKKILDLSFGDGRNLLFLKNLGFEVHGTEISKKIIGNFKEKKKIKFKVGKNCNIPYMNNFFDYILSWNSCYYLDKDTEILDNIKEISRILKKNGFFIGTIPLLSTYYFLNSKKIKKYKFQIRNDYLNIRNNSYLAGLNNKKELKKIIVKYFKNIKVAHSFNDYFGIKEDLLVFCCQKK
jgi:SAM-dependent methyltransferase